MTPTMSDTLRSDLKSRIKRGFVLHMSPMYLLKTYGDVVTGPPITVEIHPRYALCVGSLGETTFWVMLTTQGGFSKEEIPMAAKEGAWTDNPKQSYFSLDQIWIITRDMAIEAFLCENSNKLNSGQRWSWVKESMIATWPELPTAYTPHFTKLCPVGAPAVLPRLAPRTRTLMGVTNAIIASQGTMAPALGQALALSKDLAERYGAPLPAANPDAWRTWIRDAREQLGLSQEKVVRAMNQPYFTDHQLSAIELGHRLFEPLELAAWAEAVAVTGNPMLNDVPVTTQSEMELRVKIRATKAARAAEELPVCAAALAAGPVLPPAPENPTVFLPLPPQAQPPAPSVRPERAGLCARASEILSFHRITDSEAATLLKQLEASLHEMLTNDPALNFK